MTIICESDDDEDRGSIDAHGWDEETYARVVSCPREAEHCYGPSAYVAWHHWADKRRKTHRQIKCDCGLYLLMESKR